MTAVICACGANYYLNDGDTLNCSNCRSMIRRVGQVLVLIRFEQNVPPTASIKTIQPGSSVVNFQESVPVEQGNSFFGPQHIIQPASASADQKEEEIIECDFAVPDLEAEYPQAPWAKT